MTAAMFGWLATAIFVTSYFTTRLSTLTKIQAIAACLWIAYGVRIGANPVIVANVIVAVAALFSSLRDRWAERRQARAQSVAMQPEQSRPTPHRPAIHRAAPCAPASRTISQ